MPHRKDSGFTLIELLVSIVVLAIISTIGLTTYFHAQVAGRDGRRKQDIRSIQIALDLYSQKYDHYPCTGGALKNSTAGLPNWINDSCTPNAPMTPNLIENLPIDPKNSGTSIYRYRSLSGTSCNLTTDGGGYVLVALLENSSDREAIGTNNHKLCDGTSLSSSSWGAGAFIVSND